MAAAARLLTSLFQYSLPSFPAALAEKSGKDETLRTPFLRTLLSALSAWGT